MTWTQFWDMHSGGGQKLDWPQIYIEAPESEAEAVFWHRFHRNPRRVTCACCGEDYSIAEAETLALVTAYQRGCDYEDGEYVERGSTHSWIKKYQTVDEYVASGEAMFIYAADIEQHERTADIPSEGYVWHG